jgi:hypothetical protein
VSANHLSVCRRTLPSPITLQTEAFTSGAGFSATRDVVSCLQGVDIVEDGGMYDRTIEREDRIAIDRIVGTELLLQHSLHTRIDS